MYIQIIELLEKGLFPQAEDLLEARREELTLAERLSLKYMIAAEKDDTAHAIEAIDEAFQNDWPFLPSLRSLGWICSGLIQQHRFRLGLALCQAMETKNDGLTLAEQKIRLLALTRNGQDALDLLQKIWSQIPTRRRAAFGILRARLSLMTGEDDDALVLFIRHLGGGNGKRSLYDRVARLALRLNNISQARHFAVLSIKFYGGTSQHHLFLANLLKQVGEHRAVITNANTALNILNKGTVLDVASIRQCYELLTEARLALKQNQQALNVLLEYIKDDVSWVQGKTLIIDCYIALKQREKAEEVMADVLAVAPVSSQALAVQHRLKHHFSDHGLAEEVYSIKIPDEFLPQWTGDDLRARGSLWKGLAGHINSVEAILLRESRTRFVRHKLGILWLFLEPAAHTLLMVLIFLVINRHSLYEMSLPLFIITGLVPYQLFSSSFGQMISAIQGNRSLFMHPRVQVIDVIAARAILELMAALVVFGGFLIGLAYMDDGFIVYDVTIMLLGFLGLLCCGVGLGLLTASVKIVLPGVATIIQHAVKILFFTSGVFFAPEMFSAEIRDIMLLNPLLHYIGMIRSNFTPILGYELINFVYASIWALGLLTFGFIFERAFRYKLLSA